MDERISRLLDDMMKQVSLKKVLILSLGTGSILGKGAEQLSIGQKKEKLAQKQYSYRIAAYQMEGQDDIVKTEFVAEPLIRTFEPDEVFIVGTSKSSWTGFYGKFGDDNAQKDSVIAELFALEENGGKDLPLAEVKKYAQTIEGYYNSGMRKGIFSDAHIHIVVTRYGLNRAELLENYHLISDAVTSVLKDTYFRYEVAFDITHSFRSLPIYNLVILNYLQNISQVNLEIKHVYYGNVEISGENNEIAPVVDLDELLHILDLSNSVNEFKNTGNAASMLQCMAKQEEDLKNALEEFDWATQINDYNAVMESFERLIRLSAKCPAQPDKYTGLQEMILSVIWHKFFDNKSIPDDENLGENLIEDFRNMSHAERQYRLSKWYYHQNRYGQALATALEALKSYLVPMYLEWRGKEVNKKNESNQNNRQASVERLRSLTAAITNNKITLTGNARKNKERIDIICRLEKSRVKVVPIRNTFAHNLDGQNGMAGLTEEKYNYHKECIRTFFDAFEQFTELMRTDQNAVAVLYKLEQKKENKKSYRGKAVRLVLGSVDEKVFYEDYKESNYKEYSVYRLDSEILKRLYDDKKNLLDSSVFLAEYIRGLDLDLEMVHIIFHKLTVSRQLNYMVALKSIGVKYFFDESRTQTELPRLAFKIDEKDYESICEKWRDQNENDQKLRELMDKDLICVYE